MSILINKQKHIVFGMIFIYVLLFTHLAFSWHDGLKSQKNDLGNAVQPIYNTTKGHFMMTSCGLCDNPEMNRLGGHANFIFLFFLPIYYALPDPKVLLFVETLAIGLGALPLYWFGKHLFGDKSLFPLLGPFVYLINPMVHDVNLYDFRELAIAMPFILFAFYFMYTKKYVWFYIFAILLALTKEDMPLIVFMLGLYMIFVQKEIKRGLLVSVISLICFFATVEVIMPFFANGAKPELVALRYAHLGGTVPKIIFNLIFHPGLLISNLFSAYKVIYIATLLTPLLFVPIVSLEILLLSLPTVFINLLSSNPMMYNPFQYYHMAPILSFIFLAYVKSVDRLYAWKHFFDPKYLIAASVISSVTASVLLSPAPYSIVSSWEEFQVSPHAKRLNGVKKLIPDSASLSVQNNLGAHFSERLFVYTFPFRANSADYVLIDAHDPNPIVRFSPRQRNFMFSTSFNTSRPLKGLEDYNEQVLKLFNSKDYGVVYYSSNGYILFQRNVNLRKNKEAMQVFNINMTKILDRYPPSQNKKPQPWRFIKNKIGI